MILAMPSVAALLAIAANAEASPCKGAGSTTAKPIFYYTADDATLDGLDLTLVMGLDPTRFPPPDIARLTGACVRTTFVSNSRTWTLYGDDDDTFPRWVTAPGVKTVVYLASMPPPDQVHAWAEAQRRHPTHETSAAFRSYIWALVAADGDQRRVFGFYDQLPDDARLTQAMQAAIAGRTPAILGFNAKSAKADEGRIFEPVTLAVAESKGEATPVDKAVPDGVAFKSGTDGAVHARLSGLTCPLALGDDLQRSAVFTTGGGDGSQEAGCRYVGERARLAVVETRLRAGDTMRDLTTLILPPAPAQTRKPPPTIPKLAGAWGETGAASFVQTPDGARQGVILLKSGDWFIEVYALYGAEDDGAISAAFAALSAANAPHSVGSGLPTSGRASLPP
jgi:hypothetical protein